MITKTPHEVPVHNSTTLMLLFRATCFGHIQGYTAYIYILGGRGGPVVKALLYKLAGRGFDSRLCHWNFSVT